MNQEVKKINGYNIKDETARNNIENLNLNKIKTFDNIQSMKNDTTLLEGMHVKTKGYYEINDGGGAEYLIREPLSQESANGMNKVLLDNDLIAEYINEKELTPQQFGAKCDSNEDDSEILEYCINYCSINKLSIKLSGQYYIKNPISITENRTCVIYGSSANVNNLIDDNVTEFANLIFNNDGYIETNGKTNITFQNIGFNGTNKALIFRSYRNKVLNCGFNSFDTAISVESGTNWNGENQICNCTFNSVTHCIVLNAGSDGDITGNLADGVCGTFITGGHDSGYKIENNHDYSDYGSSLAGYNLTFVGNYIDGWNKLVITGNGGFNITGNLFIGDTPESGNHYALKFTASTVNNGTITGNCMAIANNSVVNEYLSFIDLTENDYFTYVTISGNNYRIAKSIFNGATTTKINLTNIEGTSKISCSMINNKATLNTFYSSYKNGVSTCYSKFDLASITSSSIARLEQIEDTWIHFIKMDNETEIFIDFGGRELKAKGSWSNATEMEVWSIGIKNFSQLPTLFN